MEWVALITAGIFETFGVAMMNQLSISRNWKPFVLLILSFCSMYSGGHARNMFINVVS